MNRSFDRREFEGIGYHDSNYDGDYLLVDRWIKRPEDLKGQSLTLDKLLPRELRRTNLNYNRTGSYTPQRFRFRITFETERTTDRL